jgi:hypothetical protein
MKRSASKKIMITETVPGATGSPAVFSISNPSSDARWPAAADDEARARPSFGLAVFFRPLPCWRTIALPIRRRHPADPAWNASGAGDGCGTRDQGQDHGDGEQA